MKNEELDRLFKQKSELFRAEPSTQAWQQLEAHLQHKKGKKIWLYTSGLAASILLIAGIWLGMKKIDSTIDPQLLSREQEKEKTEVTKVEPRDLPQQEVIQSEPAGTELSGGAEENKKMTKPKKTKISNSRSTTAIALRQQSKNGNTYNSNHISSEAELPQLRTKELEPIAHSAPDPEQQKVIALAPEVPEDVIIRYSTEDEQDSSLASAQEDPIVEIPDEKELSARAVIGFLKKVKENSNASLADIREAKNNLLSFRLGQQN